MFGQRVPDSRVFKEGVAQAIIDQIRRRTGDNIDRLGKRFKNYSNQYAKSLEFQAAGKTKGDPNLRLTGDMLRFMDLIDESRDTITIGFTEREEQLKAHGHITGSPKGPKVQRDFFGLPDDDYKNITNQFTLPTVEPTTAEVTALGVLVELRRFVTLGEAFGEG